MAKNSSTFQEISHHCTKFWSSAHLHSLLSCNLHNLLLAMQAHMWFTWLSIAVSNLNVFILKLKYCCQPIEPDNFCKMKDGIFTYVCLCLSSGDLPLDFTTRILCVFLIFPCVNVTGPTNPVYQKMWEVSSTGVFL